MGSKCKNCKRDLYEDYGCSFCEASEMYDTPYNDPEDHAARRDEALEEKANNPERGRCL